MTRLTRKEKQYGYLVGAYGLVALAIIMVPQLGHPAPKGVLSPLIQWIVGSAAILIGVGLIYTGIRVAAGLEMAAAAVFGPWSTHLAFAFPLVIWAGYVSFKRGSRLARKDQPQFNRSRQPSIDADSTIRKPPTASRRYTPPKQSKKK